MTTTNPNLPAFLDGYLPRKGDTVTFRAEAKYDVREDGEYIHARIGFTDVMVPLESVTALSRLWHEGEKVVFSIGSDHGKAGEVIATHGEQVWIKFGDEGDDGFQTFHADNLKPAPEPPAETEAAPKWAPEPAPVTTDNRPLEASEIEEEPK